MHPYFLILLLPFLFVSTIVFLNRNKSPFAFYISASIGFITIALIDQLFRWDILFVYLKNWPTVIYVAITFLIFLKSRFNKDRKNWKENFASAFITICISSVFASIVLLYLHSLTLLNIETISIHSPLTNGKWIIAQGGKLRLLNHHNSTQAQKYALDIVKLRNGRSRKKEVFPKILSDYYAYGDDVRAPCDGTVLSVENALPDLNIGLTDTKKPWGNYVSIYCNDFTVVLAHLQNEITVTKNQQLSSGDLIGKVGNSGNSTEPHLHLHAVAGKATNISHLFYTGESLPLAIDDRFLSRNDIISSDN